MPDFNFEREQWTAGRKIVVGVDEAGRGPLLGPVCVAAVALLEEVSFAGLTDSKKLRPGVREQLFSQITEHPAVLYRIEIVSAREIDELNILRATHEGMRRCVNAFPMAVQMALIDGLPVRPFPVDQLALVKGDQRCFSIAAASILAKVTRDRLLQEMATHYPQYGLEQHKGYPTKAHLHALAQYGPCPEHRRSFRPVRELLERAALPPS